MAPLDPGTNATPADAQSGPAAPFTPSFPDAAPGDALAAIRAAVPPLGDVAMGGRVYDVTPPPAGNGRNGSTPAGER